MNKLPLRSIPDIDKLIKNKKKHIKRLESELSLKTQLYQHSPNLYQESELAIIKSKILNLKSEIIICEKEINDRENMFMQRQ